MKKLKLELENSQEEVNKELKSHLPKGKGLEKKLFDAIEYSILSSGKRLRPFLVLKTSELFDVDKKRALRVAAAIEICYQLREIDLTRKPSTSEILDWISYLVQTNVLDSKVVERLKGAQTLVKHRDDRELLRAIQEKGIESATSRKSQNW